MRSTYPCGQSGNTHLARAGVAHHDVAAMPDLEIQIEGSPQDPRFVLRGEIDVSTVVALRTAVDQLDQPQVERLSLDLREVTFMDSTGLGWLAGLARSGTQVSLFEVSPSIRKLLGITGIDGVVAVADG
jgi:anti-sigma B factor antagonist